MKVEQPLELVFEHRGHEQIRDPDRAARDLVLVRGADAPPGRADRRGPALVLARFVEQRVRAQDHGTRRRHTQPIRDRDAARDQLVHLLEQRIERHDDAVADQASHVVAQDAGRNQVQHRLAIADDERVTRVVPALEANDRVRALSEHVDDGALALVTPLRADYDDSSTHISLE